jgi:hypothetical protein
MEKQMKQANITTKIKNKQNTKRKVIKNFMVEKYKLEKWIWTEADFEKMGWHDVQIHAFAFMPKTFELVFDIDYILQWVQPDTKKNETYFKFWISPATLVFENIYDLKIEVESDFGIELQNVRREEPQKPKNAEYIDRETEWRWILEAQEGEISLRSVGYKQYLRKEPVLVRAQSLNLEDRGGFSFHRGQIDN